jgi:hypothetical protein
MSPGRLTAPPDPFPDVVSLAAVLMSQHLETDLEELLIVLAIP